YLHAALLELRTQLLGVAGLRGADGREVLRVREQHAPGSLQPVVEANDSLCLHRGEIRSQITTLQCHTLLLSAAVPRGEIFQCDIKYRSAGRGINSNPPISICGPFMRMA